ncbi:MAG: hypothetical protein V1779_17600 [bacterium]
MGKDKNNNDDDLNDLDDLFNSYKETKEKEDTQKNIPNISPKKSKKTNPTIIIVLFIIVMIFLINESTKKCERKEKQEKLEKQKPKKPIFLSDEWVKDLQLKQQRELEITQEIRMAKMFLSTDQRRHIDSIKTINLNYDPYFPGLYLLDAGFGLDIFNVSSGNKHTVFLSSFKKFCYFHKGTKKPFYLTYNDTKYSYDPNQNMSENGRYDSTFLVRNIWKQIIFEFPANENITNEIYFYYK